MTDDAPAPELAVVVLSQGPRPTLPRAVASLTAQDVPVELVVVHSGPGEPTEVGLPRGVRVIRHPEPLFAGGARNVGVEATTAPYVAFLADDCEALPGWAGERVAAHRAGADAVASALVSHRPRRPIALGAHVALFVNRLPGADASSALRYGVSYTRELLERVGPFRADLRSGEDSEFNARAGGPAAIEWRPAVQTAHHGPERLRPFLADQTARGARMAAAWRDLHGDGPNPVAADALARIRPTIGRAWRTLPRADRVVVLAALPVIVLGGIAYARGARKGTRG